MTGHTAGERYRFAIHAQRTDPETGDRGGACTLLVIRLESQVLLLHHGALSTGAAMPLKQAAELADGIATAAGVDAGNPDRGRAGSDRRDLR